MDPAGRPASAAEVIDRLGAIAAVDDATLGSVAESHLISCPLVGREREKEQLRPVSLAGREGSAYRSLPLITSGNGELVVVGIVALVQGVMPLEPLRGSFVEEVARGIYDAGDVRTVYFGQRV